MKFIADLHIHSKYSRATSKNMNVKEIARWCKIKGIDVVATGDFTHPEWMKELKNTLKQSPSGLYEYNGIKFVLSAEISNIYTKNKKGRRIHTLILVPDFQAADKINKVLAGKGNIVSDGRPILGFDAKDIVKICLDASERSLIVPAHIWTPWFSVFGSNSGFNSIEECYEEESKNIYALETGLSSDPSMNWRLSSLDKYTLLSNSDAHSPAKLGREANVFDCDMGYDSIIETIITKNKDKFLYTVEFFPEEGKYHYDGHRACGIRFSPAKTKENNFLCPVCKKPLTVGVMSRVEELADREEGFVLKKTIGYKSLVPLSEIISALLQKGVNTKAVNAEYADAIKHYGNEFEILLNAEEKQLNSHLPGSTAQAILKVRSGEVNVLPGYDGVYGSVSFLQDKKTEKELALF